jgi:hypothetical protein
MISYYYKTKELRKRRIEKDGDLGRKHTVLNEKLKRRIVVRTVGCKSLGTIGLTWQ